MHPTATPPPGVGHNGPPADVCPTCGQPNKQASDQHRRLFFATIKQAYDNWPERHVFRPDDAEHLRGWLLIEAGWLWSSEITGAENIDVQSVKVTRALLRQDVQSSSTALAAMRMYRTEEGLKIVVPKSIRKKFCGKTDFNNVSKKVFEIIEEITGVSLEEFKQQKSAA